MSDTTAEVEPLDEEMIATSLVRMGVIGSGERPRCRPMEGGVSSEIWLVEIAGRRLCIKRALSRLRVEQVWEAPTSRNHHEFNWFRTAGRINPDAAPRLIGQDFSNGLFAMEYLDPGMFPVWKNQLRDGNVDATTAAAVGTRLAQIHAATAGDREIARNFATDSSFYALRIEPYLIATTNRHPDLASILARMAHTLSRTKLALVHGDVSPKNILVGRRGPVFLDAECAWYGDPAFDVAFCLNHLLLKCVWVSRATGRLLQAFSRLAFSYLQGVTWEPHEDLEKRAAHLLPGLLLARIDGKSPVEYITEESDKERVRRIARQLLQHPVDRLDFVSQAWAGTRAGG